MAVLENEKIVTYLVALESHIRYVDELKLSLVTLFLCFSAAMPLTWAQEGICPVLK